MSLASEAISGKRIVLVDVMDTLLSPCDDASGYVLRDGAQDFFSWCGREDILVGVHSDISRNQVGELLRQCSLEGFDYVWGGKEYVNVPVRLASGITALVKNFGDMLYGTGCDPGEALVVSDADIDAAEVAGIQRFGVPYFGLEGLAGNEKFSFREFME